MPRYALYYAPRPDDPLAVFTRQWLGRDPETGLVCDRPALPDVAPSELKTITAEPRRYGFHGTLKAPFALAEGFGEPDLLSAVADWTQRQAPAAIGSLKLAVIHDFFALVPEGTPPSLSEFAAVCVRDFDHFRAPLTEEEIARRRRASLTDRQDALMLLWGYPYVMEEFRFHLTLTGRLGADDQARVRPALERLTRPFCGEPLVIRDIAVFFQEQQEAAFRVRARFPLIGV
jgi:putative phosphonate metabolism protein